MMFESLWWQNLPADVVLWASIAILFLAVEILTTGFFCLFFALGAFVTAFFTFGIEDLVTQVLIFVVASLFFLVVARPLLKTVLKIQDKPLKESNVQALVGQSVLVLESVNAYEGRVKVAHTGELWTAYLDPSSEVLALEPESEAVIVKVDGAKLVIKPTR